MQCTCSAHAAVTSVETTMQLCLADVAIFYVYIYIYIYILCPILQLFLKLLLLPLAGERQIHAVNFGGQIYQDQLY